MPLNRRQFLERLALIGGAPLAYESMTALGLIPIPAAAAPFELRGEMPGVRVVVIGAGVAGLAVAYELGKLGYACQVLEARGRAGGRAFTVRRGTVSEEEGPRQVCAFDEGLYFNAGAMRIPHHHRTTLAYCRELQVPLEVFAVGCDSAYLYQHRASALAGQRIRLREARTDLYGYVAELLSKAVSEDELNQPFTEHDRQNLMEHLRRTGALDEGGRYRGSPDRGPAAGTGLSSAPLDLSDLLGSGVGSYLDSGYNYQPTMLQVVGGTDRLPAAFTARLRDKIVYRAAVREIRQSESRVTVVYTDHGGRPRKVDAEYCVCAMPLSVLATIDADFSPEFKKAVAAVPYASAGKIGLQFKRRFWEEDDDIFGGTSRTDLDITQIVYPSTGFLGRKGVLIGYYIQGQLARPMGERSPAERQLQALEQGARIHPQYQHEFENGFSVGWHRVTWNRGSWSSFAADLRRDALPLLMKPDGRVYLAGDHVSSMNAWMQGAFESARNVATAIHARASQEIRRSA